MLILKKYLSILNNFEYYNKEKYILENQNIKIDYIN